MWAACHSDQILKRLFLLLIASNNIAELVRKITQTTKILSLTDRTIINLHNLFFFNKTIVTLIFRYYSRLFMTSTFKGT